MSEQYADLKLLAAALALDAFTSGLISLYAGVDQRLVELWLARNAGWFESVEADDDIANSDKGTEMSAEPGAPKEFLRLNPALHGLLRVEYAVHHAATIPSLVASAEVSDRLPVGYDPWAFLTRIERDIDRWKSVQQSGLEDLSSVALAATKTALVLAWQRVNDFMVAGAEVPDRRLDRLARWEVELGIVGPLITVLDADAFLQSDATDVQCARLMPSLVDRRLAARVRFLDQLSVRHLVIAALCKAPQAALPTGGAAALLRSVSPDAVIARLHPLVTPAPDRMSGKQKADFEAAIYGLAADPRLSSEPRIAKWAFSLWNDKLLSPSATPAVAVLMAKSRDIDVVLPAAMARLQADLLNVFWTDAVEPAAAKTFPQVWNHAKRLYDLHRHSADMPREITGMLGEYHEFDIFESSDDGLAHEHNLPAVDLAIFTKFVEERLGVAATSC